MTTGTIFRDVAAYLTAGLILPMLATFIVMAALTVVIR